MKIWTNLLAVAVSALCTTVYVDTASAQAIRTWVSGVGDDVNPCSRTAPCKTWAGAISKTAAGGEINCIDAGTFGAVTITKSITLACEDFQAGILNSSTNGIIVNALATDVIVLRGLDIDSGNSPAGFNGVRFLAGAALHIEDCVFRDNGGAAPNGYGIIFIPAAGTPELHVSNTWITGNGSGTTGAGIQIAPTAAAGAKVVVENTYLINNVIGLRADTAGTTGAIDVAATNTSATGAPFHGFVALSGNGPVRFMLRNVVASNNAGEGVRAVGANSTIRIGGSIISGNGSGVVTALGGQILSYGTNQINGNIVDGTAAIIAQK